MVGLTFVICFVLEYDFGLIVTKIGITFEHRQKFVTSTIIGATTLSQLEENINAFEVVLTDKVLAEINKIQELIPNPAPKICHLFLFYQLKIKSTTVESAINSQP